MFKSKKDKFNGKFKNEHDKKECLTDDTITNNNNNNSNNVNNNNTVKITNAIHKNHQKQHERINRNEVQQLTAVGIDKNFRYIDDDESLAASRESVLASLSHQFELAGNNREESNWKIPENPNRNEDENSNLRRENNRCYHSEGKIKRNPQNCGDFNHNADGTKERNCCTFKRNVNSKDGNAFREEIMRSYKFEKPHHKSSCCIGKRTNSDEFFEDINSAYGTFSMCQTSVEDNMMESAKNNLLNTGQKSDELFKADDDENSLLTTTTAANTVEEQPRKNRQHDEQEKKMCTNAAASTTVVPRDKFINAAEQTIRSDTDGSRSSTNTPASGGPGSTNCNHNNGAMVRLIITNFQQVKNDEKGNSNRRITDIAHEVELVDDDNHHDADADDDNNKTRTSSAKTVTENTSCSMSFEGEEKKKSRKNSAQGYLRENDHHQQQSSYRYYNPSTRNHFDELATGSSHSSSSSNRNDTWTRTKPLTKDVNSDEKSSQQANKNKHYFSNSSNSSSSSSSSSSNKSPMQSPMMNSRANRNVENTISEIESANDNDNTDDPSIEINIDGEFNKIKNNKKSSPISSVKNELMNRNRKENTNDECSKSAEFSNNKNDRNHEVLKSDLCDTDCSKSSDNKITSFHNKSKEITNENAMKVRNGNVKIIMGDESDNKSENARMECIGSNSNNNEYSPVKNKIDNGKKQDFKVDDKKDSFRNKVVADDDDEDPYFELQEYLEKIKREINEVFEQRQGKNDELPRSLVYDNGNSIECNSNSKSNISRNNNNNNKSNGKSNSNSNKNNRNGINSDCINTNISVGISSITDGSTRNMDNNKLLVQEMPCSLNDTNSDKKLNEISCNHRHEEENSNPLLSTTTTGEKTKLKQTRRGENAKRSIFEDISPAHHNHYHHRLQENQQLEQQHYQQQQNAFDEDAGIFSSSSSSLSSNTAILLGGGGGGEVGGGGQSSSSPSPSSSSPSSSSQSSCSSGTKMKIYSTPSLSKATDGVLQHQKKQKDRPTSSDLNNWANAILKNLDNLMVNSSDKENSYQQQYHQSLENAKIPLSNKKISVNENGKQQMQMNEVNPHQQHQHQLQQQQQQRQNNILKLEKHATIPLQSFSLNVSIPSTPDVTDSSSSSVAGMISSTRSTSPPSSLLHHQSHKMTNDNYCSRGFNNSYNSGSDNISSINKNNHVNDNRKLDAFINDPIVNKYCSEKASLFEGNNTILDNKRENQRNIFKILKIEENSDSKNSNYRARKEEQYNSCEFMLASPIMGKSNNVTSKKDPTKSIETDVRKYVSPLPASSSNSTEESSLHRNVSALDEDNKSTSSSACEEISIGISSGKSGNSLDSSETENDQGEIGYAQDLLYPKECKLRKKISCIPKNEDEQSNSYVLYRSNSNNSKNEKSNKILSVNSFTTDPDPDLLEILSLCEDTNHEDDENVERNDYNITDDMNMTNSNDEQFHFNLISNNSESSVQHINLDNMRIYDKYNDSDDIDIDSVILRNHRHYNENSFDNSNNKSKDVKYGVNRSRNIVRPFNRKYRSHSIEESSFGGVLSKLPPLAPSDMKNGYETYNNKFSINNATSSAGGAVAIGNGGIQNLKEMKFKHRPFYLPINQEPFHNGNISNSTNMRELPSPSSASLHSGQDNIVIQELTTKSNSAPILLKKEKKTDLFTNQQNTLRYSRSQSDRYLAEIEALEACKWLRAAGFPQYAQMYEDQQFPIDLSNVAKDHPILENDPLQSLYRRLCILNRCANMKVDSVHHHKHAQQPKDDSDDEGFALSENWTFQPQSRRWSRIGEMGLELPTAKGQAQDNTNDISSKDSSPERFEDSSEDAHKRNLGFSTLPTRPDSAQSDTETGRLRRSGSERLKDGAKAILRRVESIKSRRRKRQNREGLVISGPQILDLNQLNQRVAEIKTTRGGITASNTGNIITYSTPPSPSATSPIHLYPRGVLASNELQVPNENDKYLSPSRLSPKRQPRTPHSTRTSPLHFLQNPMPHLIEGKSDDSSSYCSDSQDMPGAKLKVRRQPSRSRRLFQRSGKVDDIGIHSDSECCQPTGLKMILKDSNSNNTEVKVKKLSRGGSLNLGKDSKRYRNTFQSRSFRTKTSAQKAEEDKRPVVRWHSFQDKDRRPSQIFKKCIQPQIEAKHIGLEFSSMSCGQLQIIRKLALVTLTGCMEHYCPSHRSGWNWELPKFIKKIKTPDYRDKKVFGVPLLLLLQRSGHSLPFPIRAALRWLRLNALDQIGLFRKSGVKSRITKLKELIEASDINCMDIYDTQQAYDVADMLKQYYRDLPESLLTTKMSETFVAIFQHLPQEIRGDAIQSAILLLPDENREVLYTTLDFLHQVAENAQYNQMTASNLAVCWAPSLFHSSISTGRSTSVSPRRKKPGAPDLRELSETKASHECLTFMITNYKQIFTITPDKLSRCTFSYMEESRPLPLEALGEDLEIHNWRGYLYECTTATIKEGREKTRGWVNVNSLDSAVEIAFKKVGDGHPLRLWRCITEVEAPPIEVLDYILKDRSSWDVNLIKCHTVEKLDDRSEVFQYTCDLTNLTNFCILRSWQSDLRKGACVIVETSIEHQNAKFPPGGVKGVVLASRYLIEPCGGGRSRVMHLSRVDIKGKTPEWYNKCYGNICSLYLSKIRTAFRHVTDGPESKV